MTVETHIRFLPVDVSDSMEIDGKISKSLTSESSRVRVAVSEFIGVTDKDAAYVSLLNPHIVRGLYYDYPKTIELTREVPTAIEVTDDVEVTATWHPDKRL